VKQKPYDPTQPTTAEYSLTDLGAARPSREVFSVIAPTGLRAFEFALEVAAARGLDLEFIGQENL